MKTLNSALFISLLLSLAACTNDTKEPPAMADCTRMPLTDDDVSNGTTLAAGSCWLVDEPLGVEANVLVVEAGVDVQFTNRGNLSITDLGRLTIAGTADAPVLLAGTETRRGHWQGIRIATDSQDNRLEHAIISDAASNAWNGNVETQAALFADADASVSLNNVTFRRAGLHGIYIDDEAALGTFGENRFEDNGSPGRVSANQLGILEGTSTFSGNDTEALGTVGQETVSIDQSWPALPVPYRLEERIIVDATLMVEAGASFEFGENGRIEVAVDGSLSVDGTMTAPVVFRGIEATRGHWQGIQFSSANPENRLRYARVLHAGRGVWNGNADSVAAINLDNGGGASIEDSEVEESGGYAFRAEESSQIGTFARNTFRSNALTLSVAHDLVGELDGASMLTGNDADYALISGPSVGSQGTIATPQTWRALTVPYRLAGDALIEAALTIEAGATVQVAEDVRIRTRMGGTLSIRGTEAAPVRFEGSDPMVPFWYGFGIETVSVDNVIQHAVIAGAGSSTWNGNAQSTATFFVSSGSLRLENVTLESGGGYGAFLNQEATLAVCQSDLSAASAGMSFILDDQSSTMTGC